MKKIISLILLLPLCFSLGSCAFLPENVFGSKKTVLASSAQKVSVGFDDAKEENYVAFLDKLDSFAAKLTYEIYADSDKNVNFCISPVSVYMALALATECSNGETCDEILDAVGVTYDEVKNFTKVLYSFCNREFYYTDLTNARRISAFSELANSIWMAEDVSFKQDGVNNVANNYNCDLFGVDFDNGEGERAINKYIKEKTHGLIDGNIDLPAETLITLINTFYLKEVWNEYGDKLDFTNSAYDFKNADGNSTSIKLLKGYYNKGNVYSGDGYTSFFTTTEHGYKLHFILPTDENSLEDIFTSENIYNIINISDYGYVDHENKLLHNTRVFFPEYEASYDGDIKNILRNDFGINKLFDIEECDFSNIINTAVACDGVIHKCNLNVNARGIEGAAVTVMPNAGAAGPGEYKEVYHDYIVDRAFGFVIIDSYGAVLFSGVINSIA